MDLRKDLECGDHTLTRPSYWIDPSASSFFSSLFFSCNFNMCSLGYGSSSGSHHQQQPPHSLQHRKIYDSSDLDEVRVRLLQDSNRQTEHATNISESSETPSIGMNTPDEIIAQSDVSSAFDQKHSIVADLTNSVAQGKSLTKTPSNSDNIRSTTSPPRETRSDSLTFSDFAVLAILLSPALLHLWGRCFAQTSTARQIGTWFALLTLPISARLYRWETLPRFARDVLEILSYSSAFTITIDITVVSSQYMMEYPPTCEWEWLVFYPAILAAVVGWSAVVGFMWALVVV